MANANVHKKGDVIITSVLAATRFRRIAMLDAS